MYVLRKREVQIFIHIWCLDWDNNRNWTLHVARINRSNKGTEFLNNAIGNYDIVPLVGNEVLMGGQLYSFNLSCTAALSLHTLKWGKIGGQRHGGNLTCNHCGMNGRNWRTFPNMVDSESDIPIQHYFQLQRGLLPFPKLGSTRALVACAGRAWISLAASSLMYRGLNAFFSFTDTLLGTSLSDV